MRRGASNTNVSSTSSSMSDLNRSRLSRTTPGRRHRMPASSPSVMALILATITVSQCLVSHGLLSHSTLRRGPIGTFHSPHSSFSRPSSDSDGLLRGDVGLYSSVKSSSNKNGRKRRQKHLRKKQPSEDNANSSTAKTASKKQTSPGRPLSEDELHVHLNSRVNYGKSGPIGPRSRNRGIVDAEAQKDADEDRQREQQFFLRRLNNRPTLVLNANYLPLGYMPLSLWSWQDAVKAIFKGSVTVVDVYPDLFVRASNISVPLPSVIALNDYVPQKQTRPSFTRRNVFLRDEYICQYCNKRFHTADLSLDHVVPRSMGGLLTWDNAVTCCKQCNGRKGSTPVADLDFIGMKLNRTPRCPTQMELAAISARMVPKRVHPTWKPYLGIQERPSVKGDEEFIDDRYFEEEAE